MAATKTKRQPYPWFMRWTRIDVIKRGDGFVHRHTFTPTGTVGEGIDYDSAVAALEKALGKPKHRPE